MEYSTYENLKISKMTLGTVQLGLQYGIANKTGKPDIGNAHKILRNAIKVGINAFDTAPIYGDSEKIIGSFFSPIKDNPSHNTPIIITKVSIPSIEKDWKFRETYELMKKSIVQSLQNLCIDKIRICLLHSATAQTFSKNNGVIVDCLLKLKDEGFIEKIGASIYSPEDIREFLKIKEFSAIQIPLNLFDVRLFQDDILKEFTNRKIIVFARSIFLQGLFYLKPQNLPPNLKLAEKFLTILNKISLELKIPIPQLALAFVRDLSEISSLVIGVETIEQLESNIALMSGPCLSKEIRDKIIETFKDVPEQILNPSKWK